MMGLARKFESNLFDNQQDLKEEIRNVVKMYQFGRRTNSLSKLLFKTNYVSLDRTLGTWNMKIKK